MYRKIEDNEEGLKLRRVVVDGKRASRIHEMEWES